MWNWSFIRIQKARLIHLHYFAILHNKGGLTNKHWEKGIVGVVVKGRLWVLSPIEVALFSSVIYKWNVLYWDRNHHRAFCTFDQTYKETQDSFIKTNHSNDPQFYLPGKRIVLNVTIQYYNNLLHAIIGSKKSVFWPKCFSSELIWWFYFTSILIKEVICLVKWIKNARKMRWIILSKTKLMKSIVWLNLAPPYLVSLENSFLKKASIRV